MLARHFINDVNAKFESLVLAVEASKVCRTLDTVAEFCTFTRMDNHVHILVAGRYASQNILILHLNDILRSVLNHLYAVSWLNACQNRFSLSNLCDFWGICHSILLHEHDSKCEILVQMQDLRQEKRDCVFFPSLLISDSMINYQTCVQDFHLGILHFVPLQLIRY